MYQLALGAVLFHQVRPAKSLMLQFPGVAEVYQ
jgi:hypothetical protein